MAPVSLKGIINESFIRRFQGVAQQASGNQNLAAAFNGQSTSVSISQGLREGARVYGTAIQGLNAVSSVVNLSRGTLEELSEITEQLVTIGEISTRTSTSSQKLSQLEREYRELGKEFREIVENAKTGDREILTKDGIQEFFLLLGLDEEESENVADFFNSLQFEGDDELLASEEIKAERPLSLPTSAYKKEITVPDGEGGTTTKIISQSFSAESDELFDDPIDFSRKIDNFRRLEDLKELQQQITTNLDALNDGLDYLQDISQLVRITGLAMLELSDQISGQADARTAAKDLRSAILKDAGTAIELADNLDPIAAATLLLDEDSFA